MSGHEENSIKEAGGCAAGFRGKFYNFNADAEAKLDAALITVGKFVQGESGCLLGHIKAAVINDKGEGITLNLIDMDNGVEHHGTIPRSDEVNFDFMCAVLDVDEHELTHKMLHAIDDSGIDYFIDKESLKHHHHHDHEHGEGECDDPNCECHHHPDHDEEECDDPNCECHHHHHHEHGDGECDDPDCECHHHDFASMIDENGHFVHHHHHDDDEHEHHHDHEEHHHHHDDDDDDDHCCCHCHSEEKKEEKPAKKGFLSKLRKH